MDMFSALKEFAAVTQSLGFVGILFFVWWQGQKERKDDNKKWEERFQAVVKMYEENVTLVKGNERLAENNEQLAKDVQGIIYLNTQAITKLTTIIETRGVYES